MRKADATSPKRPGPVIMQLHPRVTRSTLDLVATFEGLRRRAARLDDGSWTVGHGHVRTAREGVEVSPQDARALLAWDLSRTAELLDQVVSVPLDAHQFDALVSLAFNLGEEAFRGSQVLALLNEGLTLQAAAAFEPWRRADLEGRNLVVDTLVRRRAAEKALFLTPVEGFAAAPTPVLRPRADGALALSADRPSAVEPAVEVAAPLEGDDARARLVEAPPRSASSAVVDALAERLDRLVPDAEPPPVQAAPPAPAAPPAVAAPSDPVEAPPVPPPRPQPAASGLASGPAPPPGEGRAPFPGTRPQPHPAMPDAAAPGGTRSPWIARGAVYAGIALIGLVLFIAAVVCILDRATFGFLLVGVLGVVFMIPYLLRLLGRPKPRR